MYDFTYYNPVRVHFGKKSMGKLAEELAVVGKKVLLAYGGGSIKRSGLYDRIMEELNHAGKEVFELTDIMPNPRTEKVYEGIEICKKNGVEFILAVGGGSVIDCCKAIAVGSCTEKDFWETFYQNWENAEAALPLGVILTLPATGSEMDKSAVITNWATSQKSDYMHDLLYPQFSILDPTLTYTLPKNQMVNGIVDTLSHIMELYISPPDEESVTDCLAEGLMTALINAARAALKNPEDYNARANIMWASSFALCGMLNNGKKTDWASHCIEHPLSALFDIAHGAGLAVVHPVYLEYTYKLSPDRFARFAERVWNVDPTGKTQEEVALEGVRKVREFFNELGAPSTLTELGVTEADFDRLIDLTDLSCYNYKPLERKDVRAILTKAL